HSGKTKIVTAPTPWRRERGASGHGDPTNVRCRRGAIEIGSPFELIAGFHGRSNISTARTSAGAKMRLLDSVFALCSALDLLSFFGGFVGRAMVRAEKSPRATFST